MRVARVAGCVLAFVAGMCTSVPHMQAEDVSKTLKERLFARYDQKKMTVVRGKILVTTTYGWTGSKQNFGIHYYSFASLPRENWPKQFRSRHFDLFDERTTVEVSEGVRFTDPLEAGEIISVRKFYVRTYSGMLTVDFYVAALDSKRIGRIQTIYPDGGRGLVHRDEFGVNFRCYLPMPGPGVSEDQYFDEITKYIGQYFVPADESFAEGKRAVAQVEAQKSVEIKPGMTKAEVLAAQGEPVKTITFGEKTYLKYADFTVELVSDKVTDVKTN